MTTDPHSETLKIAHNADCEYCSNLAVKAFTEEEIIKSAIDEAIERCAQKADHFSSESGYATEIAKDIRALKSKP